MSLQLYNTLTGRKEPFTPRSPGRVAMYVCGVTVYDLCHVGHARSAVVFDVIRRAFESRGFQVTFVKNFTDVDDKIVRRAQEQGVPTGELAERHIEEYRQDMAALGIRPADVEPKATEHIPQMVELIRGLIERGVAYTVDGDVYFEVRKFPRYGRLSGKRPDELLLGARVEVDERKRDPLDFALWKRAKPGEPAWESPWGPGRPGWHIECSAMSMHYLGASFDIHGGGEDLVFPHHENEIAQSEAYTGKEFVRYWIHNGFVNLGAEKMSKSRGNVLLVRELVRRHDPEALRLYLLQTHYRHPLDYAESRIAEATRALERFRILFEDADRLAAKGGGAAGAGEDRLREEIAEGRRRVEAAMDDDFNTPQALGALFELARLLHAFRADAGEAHSAFLAGVAEVRRLGEVLGLFGERGGTATTPPPELRERIEALLRARGEARARKAWGEADRLREELQQLGVVVEDTREGTTWRWRG